MPYAPYLGLVTRQSRHVLWIRRQGAVVLPDSVLLERADIDDDTVEIDHVVVGRWGFATVPEGSLDETGSRVPLLNLGFQVLPPEGRVFVVWTGSA